MIPVQTDWRDTPKHIHAGGRPEEYFKWLEKLPPFSPSWPMEQQNAWLTALESAQKAFPRRTYQNIPLSPESEVRFSWPEGMSAKDLDFVIEALHFLRKVWFKEEE